MLVVGSHALELQGVHLRYSTDIDIICTSDEYKAVLKRIQGFVRIKELGYDGNKAFVKFLWQGELKIIDASLYDIPGYLSESNKHLVQGYKYQKAKSILLGDYSYIDAATVLMLKYSHKYKKDSPFFLKTMKDIQELQVITGIESEHELEPWLWDLLKERSKETYNYSLPKLNQSKNSFFTDSVPYKYDHDTIHLAVKHLDKPAYMYYQKDEAEVDCAKDKFFAASEIVRLYGVLEESYVLALERSVIPFGTDPKKAFDKALEKVCTSITSGWFREYAYLNYYKIQEMYHKSYVNKFNSALECGTIQSYNKGQE
jgi:hypothetical protein